jgi:histidinol phosphatase-like PHP family hydrolase
VRRPGSKVPPDPLPQDLHIHTVFSRGDGAVVPEQTVELVARIAHARVIGISDHLEHVLEQFPDYELTVRACGLKLGLEVNGEEWVGQAEVPPECLIEINNRYAWRDSGYRQLAPWVGRFRFVIGSDAHQPHWLNQSAARWIARELGVEETLLFR